MPADKSRMLLSLTKMKREPACVIEYLREPAEAGMRRCVGRTHDRRRIGLNRVEQAEPLARFEHQIAQALAGWADGIVGSGRRGQPALADEPALANLIRAFGEAKTSSRRQEIARDPGWFEAEYSVPFGKCLVKYALHGLGSHHAPSR